MSYSDDITNAELNKLEKKIKRLYSDASREMAQTWDNYINGYDEYKGTTLIHHKSLKERYEDEYAKFLSGQSGYKDEAEFNLWYQTQVKRGEGYQQLADELASQATNADMIASSYINDKTPSIYSVNRDYEAYKIENATGIDFHSDNNQVLRGLITDDYNAVEFKTTSVNPTRDYEWNKEQINKALTSAIMQGKSVDKLTDAFMTVMKRDRNSAIRNARTSFTSAQNAGRQETYNRATARGIEIQKEWMSTFDERTRESHQHLDGKRVPYNERFSNGLMYPADPDGAPSEVYNCRCTMRAILPKYANVTNNQNRGTYEEWKSYNNGEYNKAKAIYSFRNPLYNKVYDEKEILADMSSSIIGRKSIKYLSQHPEVEVRIDNNYDDTMDRGSQKGDILSIYSKNNHNVKEMAKSTIHEIAHHQYHIGNCQHAEAVCFAMEKMHIEKRDFLYPDEWEYVKKLAIDNYTDLEWEKGGYGDYEQFDFVKR